MRTRALAAHIFMLLSVAALGTPAASAQTDAGGAAYGSPAPSTPREAGGSTPTAPAPARGRARVAQVQTPTVPGTVGRIGPDGLALPPEQAPAEVKAAVWAANAIVGLPYKWGGGHARLRDTGYDCSGTISYALHGAGLLKSPLDSSSFLRWGQRGRGQWITVHTNPGHAFAVIAGLRLDTSAAGDPSGRRGPRWRPTLRSTRGFRARHVVGF